jgi:hypothetical protein
MSFVNYMGFLLGTIGMCHIIVDGSIMEWFRTLTKKIAEKVKVPKLGTVVDCYLCCGTWCGFFMGWVWLTNDPWQIFACGCAGGFVSNFAAVLLNYYEAATLVSMPQDSGFVHNNETENAG